MSTITKQKYELENSLEAIKNFDKKTKNLEYQLKTTLEELSSIKSFQEENKVLQRKLLESKAEYYRTEQELKSRHQVAIKQMEANMESLHSRNTGL